MTNVDKTRLQVLDKYTALGLQSSEEDVKELMRLVALPISYWDSVLLVLQQGRWRNTEDPVRYIQVAARREHVKLERGRRPGALVGCISELKLPRNKDSDQMSHDDVIDLVNTGSLEGDWETQFAKERVNRKFLVADSPYPDAQCKVDYSKVMDEVAAVAGLDKVHRDAIEQVLVWQSISDVSREQILSHPDVAVRKQLQAAGKWIQARPGTWLHGVSEEGGSPGQPAIPSCGRHTFGQRKKRMFHQRTDPYDRFPDTSAIGGVLL
jgi:hypothetical protein